VNERIKLAAGLATLYLVWGSTYLAIRVLVRTVPGLWAAGLRFVAAALLLGLWSLVRARRAQAVRPTRAQLFRAAVVGVLVVAASLGLLTLGEQHVDSGLASLLIASVPLLVVAVRALHGERPTRMGLVGVVAGFAGLALVVTGAGAGGSATWMLVLLVAAACEAVGAFYAGRWSLPRDAILTAAVQTLAGGAVLCLAAAAAQRFPSSRAAWPPEAVESLVYLVVAGTVLGYAVWVWLLDRVAVSVVSTYAYVNPVVAVLLGYLLLGEHLSVRALVGMALVIIAVVAVVSSEEPRSSKTRGDEAQRDASCR
jgi:drug/metabolite transporter (DMT)-like permease